MKNIITRVDYANKKNETFEVYTYLGLPNKMEQNLDCFVCEKDGTILQHETWSERLQEYRTTPISRVERAMYPDYFLKLETDLADSIQDFLSNEKVNNYSGPCMMTICKAAMEG